MSLDKKTLVAVVDDAAAVRAAIADLLRSAGYAVATYGSAEEFVRAGVDGAKCVILDIDPFGTSAELVLGTSSPPVIFITAHDDSDGWLAKAAARVRTVGVFRKPFDGQRLVDALSARIEC